jgi:hypothetical protein
MNEAPFRKAPPCIECEAREARTAERRQRGWARVKVASWVSLAFVNVWLSAIGVMGWKERRARAESEQAATTARQTSEACARYCAAPFAYEVYGQNLTGPACACPKVPAPPPPEKPYDRNMRHWNVRDPRFHCSPMDVFFGSNEPRRALCGLLGQPIDQVASTYGLLDYCRAPMGDETDVPGYFAWEQPRSEGGCKSSPPTFVMDAVARGHW